MKFRWFLMVFIVLPLFASAQNTDSLEQVVGNTYGLPKLKALNALNSQYNSLTGRKALRYGRQAVTLGENLFVESNSGVDYSEIDQLTTAYYQLGLILYNREDYLTAREYFESARQISVEENNQLYVSEIDDYVKDIQQRIDRGEVKENFFSRNFGDLQLGEVIREGSKDVKIQSEIGIARMYENRSEFGTAIEHYKQAINMLRDKGDAAQIAELQLKVGVLLDSLQQYEQAQEYLSEAVVEADSVEKAVHVLPPASSPAPQQEFQDSLKSARQNLKNLSDQYARENNYEKSMEYFQLYQQLSQKMEADSLQMVALNERREAEVLLLKQQKNIADLKVSNAEFEEQQAKSMRNTFLGAVILTLIGIVVVLYFYLTKKRQHQDLEQAYSDLNLTKGKLEKAEKRIVRLLHQQVSGGVAKALLAQDEENRVARKFVCVMFLDIRDFTPMAERMNPEELIAFQNKVFGFMIDAVEKHHGTLNQLLGDGFMATFGAPVSHGNDCQHAFDAASEILIELKKRNKSGALPRTKVGIGLHAGHVVTGNVGNEARKQYSVTGNPVITASRVEQLNKQYKSQLIITEEVYDKLDDPKDLESEFIEVHVKGRSEPVKILKIA